jgi:ribosomal-protein-alanine N-acetyltransferase
LDWRVELPALSAGGVHLREPTAVDQSGLVDLLSMADATRFRLDYPVTEEAIAQFIGRSWRDRTAGTGVTYTILTGSPPQLVGLIQVRQLDVSFGTGEWECMIAPSARGSGVFVEAARLVASLAFGTIGAHRLEARVLLQNERANGALRKLGAVQEGYLRRSLRVGDRYLDQVLWALLREEWGDQWISSAPVVH